MSGDWAASALGWWHDAGVDTIVADRPRDWLAPAASRPAATAAPTPQALPGDLSGFHRWLLESADVPLARPSMRRIAPLGDAAADLMVLVDMPAAPDALLAGEAGVMFENMMRAIGRGLDAIYAAPLSVVRTPTGRLAAADLAALAPIARHHVALARPKALLLFGDSCAQALAGAPAARARGRWHDIETPAGAVRAIATMSPQFLVKQPERKREVWTDLQMLMEGLKA
jgi:DNA polymerase